MAENHPAVYFDGRDIVIDGRKTQILSGAVHYFRSMPGRWDAICRRARAMGLNTIETYIPWNLHEPRPGEYDFSGIADLERFIRCVRECGLYLIVRCGPYICAEWDNGGLPAWVTKQCQGNIRRDDPEYIRLAGSWFAKLLPLISRYQHHLGGPVILAAVENEYGSYGCDKEYLRKLHRMYLDAGFSIPLVTADGGGDQQFVYGGMLPELPVTLTMGPDECMKKFALLRTFRQDGPDFCMEYWCGAFDHWGELHRDVQDDRVVSEFEDMVSSGASVNLYMFHGGTNFGFFSGANSFYGGTGKDGVLYAPDITSYDYNAPLSEAGNITPRYRALRDVIEKYHPGTTEKELPDFSSRAYPPAAFSACAPLFDHLGEVGTTHLSKHPLPMEDMELYHGFALYRTVVQGPCGNVFPCSLALWQLQDRAQVFFDGVFAADFSRNDERKEIPVCIEKESAVLDLLVENQGYINFGPASGKERKGVQEILLGGGCNHYLENFECFALPMDKFDKLTFEKMRELPENTPAFYRAEFDIDETCDTYLVFPGVKGFVTVNGFNIGRYWNIGPQQKLFVPRELLKKGRNTIIVFEQYKISPAIEFSDKP